MDEVNERLAHYLDRTGNYRILRRVPSVPLSDMSDEDRRNAGLAVAVILDTETTGLSADDEIIELAMARIAYHPATFAIDHLVATFSALREPTRPIPADVSYLTGLRTCDVAGHSIDRAAIFSFTADATMIVAHNAAFDRPFCERAWPVFERLPWACSLTGIDWKAAGFESSKLGALLAASGWFHDGHRALDDVLALTRILRRRIDFAQTSFGALMENAKEVGVRIWAVGAPFDTKDVLKTRGYRWCAGEGGTPRAWSREVPKRLAACEIAFLRSEVYRNPLAEPLTATVTALERFSVRAAHPNHFGPRSAP
jgi:DNA polymerase-3 subunit epsilon